MRNIMLKSGFRLQRLATFGLEEYSYSLEAEQHLLTALRLNQNSLQALEKLAALYTERGQHIKAVQIIERMLKINPNYGGAYFSLGYIYRYVGLLDKSVRMMEKAAALDEGNTNYQSLGASYYNAGLYQKAIKVFEIKDKTAYNFAFLASVYGRIGEKEKALENLDLLLGMKAGGFWTSDAKANKAILLGETEKGILEVQKLENSNISDAEPIYYWASYYAALGEKEGALRLLQKSVQRGYYNLPFMEQDPFWKGLRQDKKYLEILAEVRKKHLTFKAYMDRLEKK